MQQEITSAGPLLAPDGRLASRGWARRPLLDYDRSRVRGRLKEWDYYCILDGDKGLALTFADLGVLGLLNVIWLDFGAGAFESSDAFRPFTRGKMGLPRTSLAGDVEVGWGKRSAKVLRREGERELVIDWPGFRGRDRLEARLLLRAPEDDDSLVVATPFADHPTGFYYNHKINCLRADGEVRIGSESHRFSPDRAMGVLDWGRGVWTYSNTWYWGSTSGLVDGRRVGWNIGYGFGDLSTHTENIAFVDGVGHKLDQVRFHIDGGWMDPWRFTSNDGRFEMDFEPVVDRNADVNLLIFRSTQHQVFGHFTGRIGLDDGTTLEVDRLLGFAEKVINRW